MRISDWSSDVCSSDLPRARRRRGALLQRVHAVDRRTRGPPPRPVGERSVTGGHRRHLAETDAESALDLVGDAKLHEEDRTSDVSGKSLSVRVDHGARRILKTQKINQFHTHLTL